MEALDWLIIGVFSLALIGIIVWIVRRKRNDSADYFLGGRGATWLVIDASILAPDIDSEHLIGLVGVGASDGMAMVHQEVQGWIILVLKWVFVPFYSRSMAYIMPKSLGRCYNPQSRTILSVISLISYVLTKIAMTVYAGGLIFQQVFGIKELWGIDFFWIVTIELVVLTALYTIFSDMKSVLYASVLQTPILLLGSLITLMLGFKELGGWDEMMRMCGAVTVNDHGDTMTNLIHSSDDASFPWLGALIGSAIVGFWYWCTNQFIVRHIFSGKNEKEVRRGAIFDAYLKLLPVFPFLIPGMIAFVLHQKYIGAGDEGFLPMFVNGTASADTAFPTLVVESLPTGVKGLIVCGILAALVSSLVSLFNSFVILFTIDFYKRFRPETPEKKLVGIDQIVTVVIVALGILQIPIMRSAGDVFYTYLQDVQSVLAPNAAAAFLLGICWRCISARGGMWGLITDMIIGLTRLDAKVYYSSAGEVADSAFKYLFYDMNWLFFCGWMFLFCTTVVIVVSLATKASTVEKIQGLVFGTAAEEQKVATRANQDHWSIIHTVIILATTGAFYWYFW